MAIAGEGTKTNPWLAHSYDELKEITTTKGSSGGQLYYIRLENDIDCNSKEYPKGFEWEGINLWRTPSYGYIQFDLDLNEKAIRNVQIKQNSYLFEGRSLNVRLEPNTSAQTIPSAIRNGKILNIFNGGAKNVISGYASTSSPGTEMLLEGVSFSIDGNGIKEATFYHVSFEACAVYFKAAQLEAGAYFVQNYTIFYNNANNTDFWLDIGKLPPDRNDLFYDYAYSGSGEYGYWYGCRFQGKVEQGGVQFRKLSGCVFDMDITLTENDFPLFVNSNGVFNKDKIHSEEPYSGSYMIPVTNEEMRSKDPEVLTEKGFPVVKDV